MKGPKRAPGRYCLAVCYCGDCAHYKPIPRGNVVGIKKVADERQAASWADREEPTWLDKD